MNNLITLEYDKILQQLADCALSDVVKERCLELVPALDEAEVIRRIRETTEARRIMEQIGTPPLTATPGLHKIMDLTEIGSLLLPDQLEYILSFITTCRRMKSYLKKAEQTDTEVARYGNTLCDLPELEEEIGRCIRNGQVDDRASEKLYSTRRKIAMAGEQIKTRLNALLRRNAAWFSESFISVRGGRYTLPVKYQHKSNVPGIIIDMSQSGNTCFIEPTAARKLHDELAQLRIDDENEVRRILYTLTAMTGDYLPLIRMNAEAMETLDFLFAKAKLSISMKASAVRVTVERQIEIINARHPLLRQESAVPLYFKLGGGTNGVVITGPNTGGKTVALKTVGLLSLMIQSGLHVPADPRSSFCMHNLVLCDIGDGQSITENLSTFSSHMTNIIEILKTADHESLVLLDELGSGTDPAEGMGLAVAVLDELCAIGCLFLATTHYPELKEYAAIKPGLMNARMAFDRESLLPLYRLELGEAGESCALYIAKRLGMPRRLLERAQSAAYGGKYLPDGSQTEQRLEPVQARAGTPRVSAYVPKETAQPRSERFNLGDSVMVYPQKDIGIVYKRANEKGEIGIILKGKKKLVGHKRLKLHVAASELYPDDYDFSIVFESVADRKARHLMEKKHVEGNTIIHESL